MVKFQPKTSIAVISGKGGVGKTTVAVNLAVALADRLDAKVGLLDVDITGPNVASMLGIDGSELDTSEALRPITYNFERVSHRQYMGPGSLKVMSISFFLPTQDTPIIWRGQRKTAIINQMLYQTDWGELDFLVIDTPPGTSDEIITVMEALKKVDLTCLIVTLPQKISQLDVSKAIQMTKVMGARVMGVVENMSGFWHGDAQEVCDKYDLELLARIPMNQGYSWNGDEGRPAYLSHDELWRIYADVIRTSIKKGWFKWKVQ